VPSWEPPRPTGGVEEQEAAAGTGRAAAKTPKGVSLRSDAERVQVASAGPHQEASAAAAETGARGAATTTIETGRGKADSRCAAGREAARAECRLTREPVEAAERRRHGPHNEPFIQVILAPGRYRTAARKWLIADCQRRVLRAWGSEMPCPASTAPGS
jgi:hypothetical protein